MADVSQAFKRLALSTKSRTPNEAKLFALLEQDEYKQVISLGENGQQSPLERLYRAYAYYRLGKESLCIKLLESVSESPEFRRAAKHLAAQAYYRLGQPDKAIEAYDDIQYTDGELVVNEKDDVAVNKLACQLQLAKANRLVQLPDAPSHDSAHERLFNYSLMAAAAGDAAAALQALEKGEAALERLGLDAEDADYERAPMLLQKAHLTGDASINEHAKKLKTDAVTQYLASVSFLDTQGNPYQLYKAINRPLKPSVRLFSSEDRLIAYNKIIAADAAGVSIKKAVSAYCQKYKSLDARRCAALRQLVLKKTTLKMLEAKVSSDTASMLERVAALTVAISRLVGRPKGFKRSLALLEKLPLEHFPGLLALECCLKDVIHGKRNEEAAVSEIENVLQSAQYEDNQKEGELLAGLIQRRLRLERTDEQKAAIRDAAQKLLEHTPRHPIALAALAIVDPSAHGDIPLPDLSGIDIDALERNLPLKRSREETREVKRPVRAKKVKTEAQLKQESQLDPERWLPKRDRSNYKPTRAEKAKGKGAHQGGAVDERLGEARTATPTPASSGNKKKKGKSKK